MYLKLYFMKNYKLNFINKFNIKKLKFKNINVIDFLNKQKINNILLNFCYNFENKNILIFQSYIIDFILNSYKLKNNFSFLKNFCFKLSFKKRKKLFIYLEKIILIKINTVNINFSYFLFKSKKYYKLFFNFYLHNLIDPQLELFFSNFSIKNFLTKTFLTFECHTIKYKYLLKNFKLIRIND